MSGPDLILERVLGALPHQGPLPLDRTMLADLRLRPWRARTHALTLARLHRELHAIPPQDSLRGDGASILHLDLHPANVMLTGSGPVVIDWANAARGDAALDGR